MTQTRQASARVKDGLQNCLGTSQAPAPTSDDKRTGVVFISRIRAAGKLWIILPALLLTGCFTSAEEGTQEISQAETPHDVAVVRPVSQEDLPAAIASCLEDEGFPPSETSSDGSLEYGPFTEAQDRDFLRADETCRARYPLEFDYARDATDEDWLAVYRHQRDTWLPCMRNNFGIELGQMPSEEAFLANNKWVDAARLNEQLQAAVESGVLEHMNAWIPRCPDFPPDTPSG